MKLENGLYTDEVSINQPEDTYQDARNLVQSTGLGNEPGFLYLFDLPSQPIGVIPLNDNNWVVFCYNAGYDEIGIVSNDVYTRILKTTSSIDRLNFSTAFPIKGKFRISNRGERIIAFTDNNNPPRILNIDTLPFTVDGNKTPTAAGSCDLLNLFSAGDPPQIEPSLNLTGGFLKSGAFFFSTSYTAVDGSQTAYSTLAGPIKINEDNSGTTTYDGAPAGTISSKSVTLTLYGVDTRFQYLNIGVFSVIAGESKFVNVGRIEIAAATTVYTYTYIGNEQTTTLLIDQATIQSSNIYNKAKAIAVVNDQLILGNLATKTPYDYQSYANGIVLNWQMESIYDANSLSSIITNSNLQRGGFRAFEVYAFYIVFRYKDGSYSPAYHIPGRVANAGDTNTSTLLVTAKKFQVEDTCSTGGQMSYWENENEYYPANFPTYAGQHVRHHKFPSLNFLMTNAAAIGYPSLSGRLGVDLMPVLTYNISNVVIPADLLSQIDGWQIYYAKRDISNMTCVGQGHLVFSHQNANNSSNLTPNTNIHCGTYNGSLDVPDTFPLLTKLSFHSPDLLLNKPSIAPSYIRNEARLGINVDAVYAAVRSESDPIVDWEADSYKERYILLNYIYTGGNRTALPTVSGDLIRAVSTGSPLYMAPNVINGSYYNIQSSEYINLDITSASTLSVASAWTSAATCDSTIFGVAIGRRREQTYLANLCQLIKTVYSSFQTQPLVASSNIIDPSVSTTATIGVTRTGDNYCGAYSSTTTMFRDSASGNTSTDLDTNINTLPRGMKVIRYHLIESNINIKLRHEGTDNNSKYYGKSSYKVNNSTDLGNSYLRNFDVNKGQIIEYNTDFTVVNSYNPVYPKNSSITPLTKFPFRVIGSEKNANELLDSGWRTYLANNYFDMVTTKGEISNLEGYADILYIHLKNSLYKTLGLQSLKVGTIDVTVGSGELFAQQPQEVFTSELGYLGNQNLFGCGVTKLGYIFFDASQGKIFEVGNGVRELSSQGMYFYLSDNFATDPVVDNPFTSTGVNMAYDIEYDRVLLSKKGAKPFTLSYSASVGKQGGFISFHDYIPDYMFNTRTKVYSFKALKVYKHNHTNFATYYDGTVYPTSVMAVFNQDPTVKKYFESVNWQTEVIKSDYTSVFHKTFTKIMLLNSYQCSGDILLSYPTNIFNAETTWNFNSFYDIVVNRSLPFINASGLITSNLSSTMSWFKQRRFVDKWVAVTFTYDNIDQNTLFLYDVNVQMRKSER